MAASRGSTKDRDSAAPAFRLARFSEADPSDAMLLRVDVSEHVSPLPEHLARLAEAALSHPPERPADFPAPPLAAPDPEFDPADAILLRMDFGASSRAAVTDYIQTPEPRNLSSSSEHPRMPGRGRAVGRFPVVTGPTAREPRTCAELMSVDGRPRAQSPLPAVRNIPSHGSVAGATMPAANQRGVREHSSQDLYIAPPAATSSRVGLDDKSSPRPMSSVSGRPTGSRPAGGTTKGERN